MFHELTTPEILPGNNNISRFHVASKIRVQSFKQIRFNLLHLFKRQSTGQFFRENLITRYIVYIPVIPHPVTLAVIIFSQHDRFNPGNVILILRSLEMNHRGQFPSQSSHGHGCRGSDIFLNTGVIRPPDVLAIGGRDKTAIPDRRHASHSQARSATGAENHRP